MLREIYAKQTDSHQAIIDLIFSEQSESLIRKLTGEEQCVLHTLKTNHADFYEVIRAYNSFAKPEDKLFSIPRELR